MENCVEHVKTAEESYNESDKIIDLQIEEVFIELGNESPESDNDVVVVVVVVYLFTNITSEYTHTEKLKTRLQSTITSIYR